VITDAHHENMKDALRTLNARLVELDDRVPDNVADAVAEDKHALDETGWQFISQAPSPIRGTNGAIETFVLARRQTRSPTTPTIRSEPDDRY
jgi:predicted rRNA methylase YqxC with S4 and FtsJ domains